MPLTSEERREFVGLIVNHQVRLRAYIISLMPGTPGVSDVLQEANIILWEKMESFELGSNFTAWAFRIARYEVQSHCRKLKRSTSFSANSNLAEKIADQIESDHGFGNDMMEDRISALQTCMAKLSPEARELITMRYSSKTSLAEFARSSGRSDSSLRTMLRRTRTALRKCIFNQLTQAAR